MKKTKLKRSSFDQVLFGTVVILSIFGLIMIFSASAPSAFHEFGDSFHFVKKQLIWTVLGFFALLFTASFKYTNYKKLSGVILVINFIALILVLLIGTEVKGATRWIDLGIGTIQPSEFTKIAIIIGLATYFCKLENVKQTFKNVYIPLLLIVGIPFGLLIMQPHFSVIMIISIVVLGMMIIFGIKFKFYVPGLILGGATSIGLVLFSGYRLKRVLTFLDPFADKLGDGWQVVQSLYAIASGGLLGLGLSRSRQKHLYIPEPQNDFIFSIICEELGYIGAIIVIVLFSVLLWRCFKVAINAPDSFGSYMAFGFGFLLSVQALLNIGVVTSSIPPTGIPMPFFSAGGSSFVFQMIAIGIILNISRYTNEKES